MTTEQKLIKTKVGVFELAKQLGNVSKACQCQCSETKTDRTEDCVIGVESRGKAGTLRGRLKVSAEIRDLAREHGAQAIERLVALMHSANEALPFAPGRRSGRRISLT